MFVENPTHSRAMLIEEDAVDGKLDAVFPLPVSEPFSDGDDKQSVPVVVVVIPRSPTLPWPPVVAVVDGETRAPPLRPPARLLAV